MEEIMENIRRQTYTIEKYLQNIRERRIRTDTDMARYFVWNSEQISELIVTILTDGFVPPLILGELQDREIWIIDGGQRSAALSKFRYGNFKLTSAAGDPVISYAEDHTEGGEISFDLRNVTYDRLPDQWKKKFNEYPIEAVIYERCDAQRISEYMRRYNNHVRMNTDERALTYLPRFAGTIREIVNSRFFVECSGLKEDEKIRGAAERTVVETVMCTCHLNHWNRHRKAMCKYLNEHASEEDFDRLRHNLGRLAKVLTDDTRQFFTKRGAFLYITLFDRFTKMGKDDRKFAAFLRNRMKGDVWADPKDTNPKDTNPKDKAFIVSRLALLERQMMVFLKKGEDVHW